MIAPILGRRLHRFFEVISPIFWGNDYTEKISGINIYNRCNPCFYYRWNPFL